MSSNPRQDSIVVLTDSGIPLGLVFYIGDPDMISLARLTSNCLASKTQHLTQQENTQAASSTHLTPLIAAADSLATLVAAADSLAAAIQKHTSQLFSIVSTPITGY
jgi:hypothetical protein